jgi:hypothetical protein
MFLILWSGLGGIGVGSIARLDVLPGWKSRARYGHSSVVCVQVLGHYSGNATLSLHSGTFKGGSAGWRRGGVALPRTASNAHASPDMYMYMYMYMYI